MATYILSQQISFCVFVLIVAWQFYRFFFAKTEAHNPWVTDENFGQRVAAKSYAAAIVLIILVLMFLWLASQF